MNIFFINIFIANLLFFNFHPAHIAMNNIEYNIEKKKFDIVFKVFTKDFELIILKKYKKELKLNKENEIKNSKFYIQKYINENFSIFFDVKKIKQKDIIFQRKNYKDDSSWFYFSLDFDEKFKSVTIKNTIMTDFFKDQKNLIFFNYKGFQKTEIFNSSFFKKKYNLNKK